MTKNRRYEELGKLWKQSRPQNRRPICYTINCSSKCARNHLLQQNGIISQIEKHSHVRELRTDWFQNHNYYSFKRIGWERAMAIYGYCAKCDQNLFSPIEVPESLIPETNTDFCRYSLRPIAHELRKKEGNLEYLALRDGNSEGFSNAGGEFYFSKLKSEELQILFLKYLLAEFTEGLSRPIPIIFTVRELPRIDICASSILIPPELIRLSTQELLEYSKSFKGRSFNIINLFPTNNSSLLILGTHEYASKKSRDFTEYVKKAKTEELLRLVSNILVSQIEDWAISERLFSILPTNFENFITKVKTNQSSYFDKDTGINLFNLK